MSEEIISSQSDPPLNMVDSGINVFDVVGGHKLRVPTGVEDPARHAAQEVLQQSPHHVDRHLLRAQIYSLSWQKWERKGLKKNKKQESTCYNVHLYVGVTIESREQGKAVYTGQTYRHIDV